MSFRKHDAYRVYLRFSFLWSLSLTLAFTVTMVYLVMDMSLDPLQMVLVGTALELSAFAFEIPTGVVADTYSRRVSVTVGVFLMGLSFFVFVVPLFPVILLSQVFLGLGWTFISGANSAWLADEIGEEAAGRAYMRGSQMGQVASVAGIVLSIALALVDLRLPIMAAGVSLFGLGLYLLLFMPETGFVPASREDLTTFRSMVSTTRDGIRTIRGKPVLLTLMLAFVVWGAFSEGYDRLWTLHVLENFDIPALGEFHVVIWFGIIGLTGVPISLAVTEYVRRRVSMDDQIALARTLIISSVILLLALIVFASAEAFGLALGALWLIGAMRSLTYPLREAWVNQGLNPRVRATVLSMSGQMDAVGQIVGGPVIGLIAQQLGVRVALALGSLLLLPILALYERTIRQNGRITEEIPA